MLDLTQGGAGVVGSLAVVFHVVLNSGQDVKIVSLLEATCGQSGTGVAGLGIAGNRQSTAGHAAVDVDDDLASQVQVLSGLAGGGADSDGSGHFFLGSHIVLQVGSGNDNIGIPVIGHGLSSSGSGSGSSGRRSRGSGGRSSGSLGCGGLGCGGNSAYGAVPINDGAVVGGSAVGVIEVQDLGVHLDQLVVADLADAATGSIVGSGAFGVHKADDTVCHINIVIFIDLTGGSTLRVGGLIVLLDGQLLAGLAGVQTDSDLTSQVQVLGGSHGQRIDGNGAGELVAVHFFLYLDGSGDDSLVPISGLLGSGRSDLHIAEVGGQEGDACGQSLAGVVSSQSFCEQMTDGVNGHAAFVDIGAVGGTVEAGGQTAGGIAVLGNTLSQFQVLSLVQGSTLAVGNSIGIVGDVLEGNLRGSSLAFGQSVQSVGGHQDVILVAHLIFGEVQSGEGDIVVYTINVQVAFLDSTLKGRGGVAGDGGDLCDVQGSGGCGGCAQHTESGQQQRQDQQNRHNAMFLAHRNNLLLC